MQPDAAPQVEALALRMFFSLLQTRSNQGHSVTESIMAKKLSNFHKKREKKRKKRDKKKREK
jgi:hypothetical protein